MIWRMTTKPLNTCGNTWWEITASGSNHHLVNFPKATAISDTALAFQPGFMAHWQLSCKELILLSKQRVHSAFRCQGSDLCWATQQKPLGFSMSSSTEQLQLTEKPFPCQEKTLSLPFSMVYSLSRLLLCQPCHSSGTWASRKGSQQQTLGQISSLKLDSWQENEQRCQSKENILGCGKGRNGMTAQLAEAGMELKPPHTFPIE